LRDGLIYNVLITLARRSPMLLLALGGSIFAILRWKRHPRVSLMTVSAMVIYMIDAVVFQIFLYYFPFMIRNVQVSPKAIDWLYFFIFFFQDFVFAIITILLVAAAFSQRNATPAASTA
jgi:hypothetical protein